MRKIPTLFVRDPADMSRVTDEVHPDCGWVLAGEGIATRKYDGTCMRFDAIEWWARREVKPGKAAPDGWFEVDRDEITGKAVGWEPVAGSPFAKMHAEATAPHPAGFSVGTYELCGPKINRNPEGYSTHILIAHRGAEILIDVDGPRDAADIRRTVIHQGEIGWEGLVWHHPDGRMAKLKARDLRERPAR